MLGLRLAAGVERAPVESVLDAAALRQLVAAGVVGEGDGQIHLTRRGRMLANDVTTRLLRDDDDARSA